MPSDGAASTGAPCFASTMRDAPLPFVQLTFIDVAPTEPNVTFDACTVGSAAGPVTRSELM